MPHEESDEPSMYEQFGGHQFFVDLVADFYSEVAKDDKLRKMYPEENLEPAAGRLRMFLEQYWGGPRAYSSERGHPRLQLRHGPFAINEDARDRWLRHMRTALDARDLKPQLAEELWRYLFNAAHAMVNTFDE